MKKLFYAFALIGMFILAVPSNAIQAQHTEESDDDDYENCPTVIIKCYDGSRHYAVCCSREDHITWCMLLC